MRKTFSIILLLCLILSACAQEKDYSRRWVDDSEEVLTEYQIQVLDSIISDFEARTTNEIAIVTVHDIGDSLTMSDYAVELGKKLGVGKKDKDNGLVILFSRNMRETFLATGHGTEKILKDEICKQIVDTAMIPYFKQQDYYGGLKAGLLECMKRWEE